MAPMSHQNTYSFTFFPFLHLLFLAIPISCNPFPSFGYPNFSIGSSFGAHLSLYGDAKVDQNGSFVQVTTPNKFSSGRVMYKKSINFNDGNRKTSFSTYFSFSLSQQNGDGLAFLIVPHRFSVNGYDGTLFGLSNELSEKKNKPFLIEFDTKTDQTYAELNGNHVGVDVGSLASVKVANVSNVKLVLNSGDKLQCWIDYEATSKRLEIRLSNKNRPVEPLLSSKIDLSALFNNKPVFIGLSSSNSNSSQVCKLYSWSFKLRPVPYWMHSQPLDPQRFGEDGEAMTVDEKRGNECIVRFVTALIFGTVCGALGAFIGLCVWTMLVSKNKAVAPEELMVPPIECGCDKFKNFVVEKCVKVDDFKCVV